MVIVMADLFEQKLEELSKMSEDELNELLEEEKINKCICKTCSTYNDCMQENMEGLFCALTKSECDIPKKNCICNECPVYSEYGLKYDTYCIKGSEAELREK